VERPGICTIGATNRTDTLDPAVRSRFEEEIEFILPNEQERYQILESNISTFPLEVADVDLSSLAKMTEGLSGRDLVEKVLKTALHRAIIDDRDSVTQEDFENSIKKIKRVNETLNPEKMYI
jgi:AAA family ATPase